MARVFSEAPRNELESRGCEACHGSGREHMDTEHARDVARAAGTTCTGPKSSEFIIRFGKDAPLPIEEQSARCLQCHEKGQRLFWKGSDHESRGLGCITCHQIHQKPETMVATARFTEPLSDNRLFTKKHPDGDLLPVPSVAPGAASARFTHADPGGQGSGEWAVSGFAHPGCPDG